MQFTLFKVELNPWNSRVCLHRRSIEELMPESSAFLLFTVANLHYQLSW